MSKDMKTNFELKIDQNKLVVELKGEINAQTDFPQLTKGGAKELVIDLAGIGYMNSGGVKNWMSWIAAVNNAFRGTAITFVNLPSVSARQAAQIKDFLPNGANIQSFIVPYYCNSCMINAKVLYKKGVNWDSSWEPEEKIRKITYTKCPTCGTMIEIDAVPEHYKNY